MKSAQNGLSGTSQTFYDFKAGNCERVASSSCTDLYRCFAFTPNVVLACKYMEVVSLTSCVLLTGTGTQPAVGYPSAAGYPGASQTSSPAYQPGPQAYHEEYQKPQPQVGLP